MSVIMMVLSATFATVAPINRHGKGEWCER